MPKIEKAKQWLMTTHVNLARKKKITINLAVKAIIFDQTRLSEIRLLGLGYPYIILRK